MASEQCQSYSFRPRVFALLRRRETSDSHRFQGELAALKSDQVNSSEGALAEHGHGAAVSELCTDLCSGEVEQSKLLALSLSNALKRGVWQESHFVWVLADAVLDMEDLVAAERAEATVRGLLDATILHTYAFTC